MGHLIVNGTGPRNVDDDAQREERDWCEDLAREAMDARDTAIRHTPANEPIHTDPLPGKLSLTDADDTGASSESPDTDLPEAA